MGAWGDFRKRSPEFTNGSRRLPRSRPEPGNLVLGFRKVLVALVGTGFPDDKDGVDYSGNPKAAGQNKVLRDGGSFPGHLDRQRWQEHTEQVMYWKPPRLLKLHRLELDLQVCMA